VAARELDPEVRDESRLAGTRAGHLVELFETAGLLDVESSELLVRRDHASFDEWWAPFMHGVGPAGTYVSHLPPRSQDDLRERCREMLPAGPFTIEACAWAARGIVGERAGVVGQKPGADLPG
jgi:hypothetical protein